MGSEHIDGGRQVVLSGPGQLEVTAAAAPVDLGPDELVIHPDAVGICATDLELLNGTMAYLASGFARYPLVPGHEWTGVVAAVGHRVEGFAPGDRVVGECSVGCGRCECCRAGTYHLCPNRTETGIAGRPGGLTDTLVFPAAATHRLPDQIEAVDAALIEPLAVAYRGLARLGGRSADAVAIVGAGTIGLLCALVARALGSTDIDVVEIDPSRRAFAAELGFNPVEQPSARYPRVVEASGTVSGVQAAIALCANGGAVLTLGLTGAGAVPVDLDQVVLRDLTVRGSLGSPGVWPDAIDLVASGAVRPSVLVSHEFPLEQSAAAFAMAGQRADVRKVLIRPGGRHGGTDVDGRPVADAVR